MAAADKERPSALDKPEKSVLEAKKNPEDEAKKKKDGRKLEKEMKEAKKELDKDKEEKAEMEIKKTGKGQSLNQGPEYNVAHHDMYPGPDGYNFDFDKSLRGDTLRVTPTHA